MADTTTKEHYFIWIILFAGMSLIPWAAIPMDMVRGTPGGMGRIINTSAIFAVLYIFPLSKSLRLLRGAGERSILLFLTAFLAYASLRTAFADVPAIISYAGLFSILGAASAGMSLYALKRDGYEIGRHIIMWTAIFALPLVFLPFIVQATASAYLPQDWYLNVYGLSNIRAAGHFTAIAIALLAPYAAFSRKMSSRAWGASALVLALWATLFWSGSRAGLLALVPGLLVAMMFSAQRIRLLLSNAALFLGGALASTAYFLPSHNFGLIQRLTETGRNISKTSGAGEVLSAASSGRSEIWHWAIGAIAQKPWGGWGYGAMINIPGAPYFYHTHNIVLEYALAFGIPVAVCVFALLSWLTWRGLRNVTRNPSRQMIAFAAIMMVLPVYSLASGVLINPYQLVIYLCALAMTNASGRTFTAPNENLGHDS